MFENFVDLNKCFANIFCILTINLNRFRGFKQMFMHTFNILTINFVDLKKYFFFLNFRSILLDVKSLKNCFNHFLYFVFYFYYRVRGFKFIGFNPICIYYRVRGFKFIGFNPICIYVKDIDRVSTGIQKWLRGFFYWMLCVACIMSLFENEHFLLLAIF